MPKPKARPAEAHFSDRVLVTLIREQVEELGSICQEPRFKNTVMLIVAAYAEERRVYSGRTQGAAARKALKELQRVADILLRSLGELPISALGELFSAYGEHKDTPRFYLFGDRDNFEHVLSEIALLAQNAETATNGYSVKVGRAESPAEWIAAYRLRRLFKNIQLPFTANTWNESASPAVRSLKVIFEAGEKKSSIEACRKYIAGVENRDGDNRRGQYKFAAILPFPTRLGVNQRITYTDCSVEIISQRADSSPTNSN